MTTPDSDHRGEESSVTDRGLSRRAILGTLGAGALTGVSAVASAATTTGAPTTGAAANNETANNVTTTATPTGAQPPAPEGLSARRPTRERSIKLTWGDPVDPCNTSISQYEILLDGSVEETVPVGINHAWVSSDRASTVGVRSVDDAGRRSATTTDSVGTPSTYIVDPAATVSSRTPDQAVATGVRLAIPIISSSVIGSPTAATDADYEVVISSPCVARIRSASAGGSASVSADGTSATVTPIDLTESDSGSSQDPIPIGCVEVETTNPGHTGVRLQSDYQFVYDGELAVAEDGAVPATTEGLDESCPNPRYRRETVGDLTVQDLDGDGEFMDLTGNGEIDGQDVVTYFQNMDEPFMTENPQYFDYTDNGEIDYQDLIALWNEYLR